MTEQDEGPSCGRLDMAWLSLVTKVTVLCPSIVAYVCLPVDVMKTAKYSRCINRPYLYQ